MNRRLAAYLFLSVCVILAILLVAKRITPLWSGAIFAVALVVLGAASRGFRR